ncbi:MAG: Myeloperoxidase, thyroid peroxidase, cyclooxygenase catalytic domain [Nitrospira sp.]|nr:MAG: Myeloperoxidase, thyroid peroxidase, cyclooxygenase catalytic domain [Nitrospira sp.]
MVAPLRKLCLAVGIVGVVSCMILLTGAVAGDQHRDRDHDRDRDVSFTRMFPDLPPFAPQTDAVRDQVKKLGEKGGLIDAVDILSDPALSIANPAQFSPNNPDNPNMTAGMTFLGQFLDHDITFDPNSPLLEKTNPKRTTNFRTPRFDLDSVYGGGPERSPELYDLSSGLIKFRVDAIPGSEQFSRHGAVRFDLPRDPATLIARLGDPRNDENVILSQLHVAMLRFHNAVTDRLRADPSNAGDSAEQIFREARRQVRWHYQWIIVHEFLPLTIRQERVDDLLQRGSRFHRFDRENPLIPIEFSVAAYRFGHSQIRPSYRLNFGRPDLGHAPFFVFLFDDAQDPNDPDPSDLRGGKRAPRRFVDWQTFFNFGDGNFRPNKKIDAKLSSVVMLLPGSRGPAPGLPADGVTSLASRNLMRHVNFGIPSGQAIARRLGLPALTSAQLSALAPFDMERSTPLWLYILKEAELMEDGLRLGSVGGRIVGEVFIGLLKADETAYLSSRPRWTPWLPSATSGDFRMTDLLTFAGVVHPLD